jgi:RHS repeat-associated protein
MGCKKITYQNISFLEVIHQKNATALKKNRLYGDHLGNIRLSYSDSDLNGSIDPNTEIIEENNYYPFGLEHKGYNNVITSTNPAQDYKYNGVELEESLGLDLYEMDFRMYDPAIARFNGIDPVTHFSQGTSIAFDNNPVFWADPSGADVVNDFGALTSDSGAIYWGQADSSQNNGGSENDENNPEDWFENKEGRVVWFDNTNKNFTTESGEQWNNIGSNLKEVGESLDLPDAQNSEWKDLEIATLGGEYRGAFGAIVLKSSAQVSFSLNVENGGESGLELIDGQTEVTGVNINMTVSTETGAPGVNLTGIGGNFGIKEWNATGNNNIISSSSFVPTHTLSGSPSHASGRASLTLRLSFFRRQTHKIGRGGSLNLGVKSTSAFKLDYNGREGSFSTSNTIKIK